MRCSQWRSQKFQLGGSSLFPFPHLSFFVSSLPAPLPFAPPSFSMPSFFLFYFLPLEVGSARIQPEGLGIWCILALKDEIWWQQS